MYGLLRVVVWSAVCVVCMCCVYVVVWFVNDRACDVVWLVVVDCVCVCGLLQNKCV